MGKWLCSLTLLLSLAIGLVPVQAQGVTIRQIIDGRADLSTFASFIDASFNAVEPIFAEDGPITVFAPTNTAFQNLASFVDVSITDLLNNPEAVSQLVQYHVIDGAYTGRQLATQFDGQVVQTRLPLAFVSLRVTDVGGISMNNVVEIIETDIRGSNGVIHIVNDVLLNRIIAETIREELDTDRALEAITPNPAIRTTPVPQLALDNTEPDAAAASTALRVAHLATDVGPVDVYVDGVPIYEDVPFIAVADFAAQRTGSVSVSVTPANAVADAVLTDVLDVDLRGDAFYTVAIVGSGAQGSLTLELIEEDYSELNAGQNRVTYFHAIEDAPPVAVQFGDDTIIDELVFMGWDTQDFAEGIYDPLILSAIDRDELADPLRVSLWGGTYYFFAIAGTADAPQIVAKSVAPESAQALREGRGLVDMVEAESTEANPQGTLLEILQASGDFSILLDALDAADPIVFERLGTSVDEITLLAPTNQAFTNLLATLGITAQQLLANEMLLTDILRYHIIEDAVTAADLRSANGTSIVTLLPENQAIFVTVDDESSVVLNNFVRFEAVDIEATNGIIHAVDNVLLPQIAIEAFGL